MSFVIIVLTHQCPSPCTSLKCSFFFKFTYFIPRYSSFHLLQSFGPYNRAAYSAFLARSFVPVNLDIPGWWWWQKWQGGWSLAICWLMTEMELRSEAGKAAEAADGCWTSLALSSGILGGKKVLCGCTFKYSCYCLKTPCDHRWQLFRS